MDTISYGVDIAKQQLKLNVDSGKLKDDIADVITLSDAYKFDEKTIEAVIRANITVYGKLLVQKLNSEEVLITGDGPMG